MKLKDVSQDYVIVLEGIRISSNVLKRALENAKGLQMGFEVEFAPEGGADELSFNDIEYDNIDRYFQDTTLDTDILYDYFREHLDDFVDISTLEDEFFGEWFDDNEDWYEDWLNENGYEDHRKPPSEKEVEANIKEDMQSEMYEYIWDHASNNVDTDDIAKEWYRQDPSEFIQHMEWELNDKYTIDDYGDITPIGGDLDAIAASLEEVFPDEKMGVYNEYHGGGDKELDSWYVEPDTSVVNGKEISSPVKSVAESLADLEKVFGWMSDNNVETTDETGLHISLSFENELDPDEMDWVKLAVLMGEKYLLDEFDRLGNQYTESQLEKLETRIANGDISGIESWRGYDDIKKNLKNAITKSKNTTFNIESFEDTGRIEFRIMGNTDYHHRFDDVKKGIGRYILFLEIAKNPNLYKKEYLKKIGKLVSSQLHKEDPLKAAEKHVKVAHSSDKKWVRAITSAYGAMDDAQMIRLRDLLVKAEVVKRNEGDATARSNLLAAFWFFMSSNLVPSARKAIRSNVAVAESCVSSFTEFLFEKATPNKWNRMKMVARKINDTLIGATEEEYKKRFTRTPDDIVKTMRPGLNVITDYGTIAALLFPQADTILTKVLDQDKKIVELGNKLKNSSGKDYFFELLKDFSGPGIPRTVKIQGEFRNFLYWLHDEPVKNDPNMKKVVKHLWDSAETGNIPMEKPILDNTIRFPNQEETIDYIRSIVGNQAFADHVAKRKGNVSKQEQSHTQKQPTQQSQSQIQLQQQRQQAESLLQNLYIL